MTTNFPPSIRIGIDARPALNQRTGVGNYVFHLIQSLAKISIEEEFLLLSNSFKDRIDIDDFKELKNCSTHHFRFPNMLMNLLWDRFGGGLMNAATNNANVLHFTGQIPKNPGNYRSIATVHDLFNVKFPESVAPEFRINPQTFARSLNKIQKIIAVSEYTKTDLISFLGIPDEKIMVAPHGVEMKSISSKEDKKEHNSIKDNRFNISEDYLLCVGTLEPRKNYPKMLEAFKIINKNFPNLKLVIAGGDGWQSHQIHQNTKTLKLENSVLFLGYVGFSDLPALYSGASAFIFPSIYEGFGLPILEAFSLKVPVALSGITSLPEVAGDAAVKFDPEDPEDIARQTIRLLEDSDLRENLIQLGSERIKEFTWGETARKTLEVYRSLGEPS